MKYSLLGACAVAVCCTAPAFAQGLTRVETIGLQQQLRDDPGLIANAIEELLRAYTIVESKRWVTRDTAFHGVTMKKGDWVFLGTPICGRDEREFPDPDRFDAARVIDRHLGFGHGVHVCIGAHVARLEGVVLVQELLARFPRYEVVEAGLAREVSEFHVGWARMPVTPVPGAGERRTVTT